MYKSTSELGTPLYTGQPVNGVHYRDVTLYLLLTWHIRRGFPRGWGEGFRVQSPVVAVDADAAVSTVKHNYNTAQLAEGLRAGGVGV